MNTSRVKVLGLLALPLIALAVVVVLLSWAHSTAQPTEATGSGGMELVVKGGDKTCADGDQADVCVSMGGDFTLSVEVTTVPAGGYIGLQTYVEYDGLTYTQKATTLEELVWPDVSGATALRGQAGTHVNHGGLTGLLPPQPKSNFAGNVVELNMSCPMADATHTVDLLPLGDPDAGTDGAGFVEFGTAKQIPASDTMDIHCMEQPTATPSNTPTDTPTPTPTNTPVSNPQFQKLDVGKVGDDPAGDSLSNLFLTRQGDKIPPVQCVGPQGGSDVDVFAEAISIPIAGVDPKDPEADRQLGAFEFEVNYDETQVCVQLIEGTAVTDSMVCTIQDAVTKPTLEGVARMGCVTIGKETFPDTSTEGGRTLAYILVRPQPEVYSLAKANQDNGVVVQLNNVGCDLSDLQGHAIKVFSCEDADVTIRYLEADVEPDCAVDTLDTQAIAFRWGADEGSLLYNDRMNLEPSGAQADDDIDINDLQFVYGRFGSDCTNENIWPPQPPVNPKE